ncbi:hypothetical protein [Xanthomonas rydalmerensis]|uniref:Uncharacterized protein n=1 Tax=Xanthomonas rydalmerensis TaxID=3046274 RepID=A0ABZ0JKJ1_9XANT|nr:hypothetical protein [Xanthomonas sp. DM-2023]WOS39928.1 hypothetical protein QN243_16140 [Xanthomonas sp. DM-2023]WOS44112.1 hypothetical protein QN242_16140 [Xanthomonas sp. DM-2023]WOS48292.1 hypothetical protein QN240_16140 [Xanthomonas sp. DM-2023]WOS52471.1 hypothetical protein QN244_16140 [Xanthomonas sp. DM-2023]WOS56655.1 hypothetical protein QN245_16140 [Xanthomonas sp. DM-2023]
MSRPIDQLAEPRVLRLHMEGVEELGGDVRLGAFIDKLAAFKAALAETGNLVSREGSPAVDFVVSELSHNSPAMVGVLPISLADSGQHAGRVADSFVTFLGQVRNRTARVDSDRARLVGHLRKLVAGVGERFERLWIDGPGIAPIPLDDAVAKALDDALPDVRREFGAVKGVVKRYSGVGKQPYFKIVPPVGGVEIKCVFPLELLTQAAASVEHNATVEGELKSYEDDFWPYEVRVRHIEIHPRDSDLPTLSELAGSAPDSTGELSAAEFVRELRNEW